MFLYTKHVNGKDSNKPTFSLKTETTEDCTFIQRENFNKDGTTKQVLVLCSFHAIVDTCNLLFKKQRISVNYLNTISPTPLFFY